MGDFNCILDLHEKRGGNNSITTPAIREFQNFFIWNAVTDMGFIGKPFIWPNMRNGTGRVLEILDKGSASN